jgi:hypothetical protein
MTETIKWTPGPWIMGKSNIRTLEGFKVHTFPISGSGQAIACVFNGSVGKEAISFGNQKANAHLIAAAPELYDALFRIMNSESPVFKLTDLHDAHRALAKARGEA